VLSFGQPGSKVELWCLCRPFTAYTRLHIKITSTGVAFYNEGINDGQSKEDFCLRPFNKLTFNVNFRKEHNIQFKKIKL